MSACQQVEPRTPISSIPFTITTSGSYYLTQNLSVGPNVAGITVNAADVTIDMRGFTLTGGGGAPGSASGIFSGYDDLTVTDGTVKGFSGWGIRGDGTGNHFRAVQAIGNGAVGIWANGGLIEDCLARGNVVVGVFLGPSGGVIRNCRRGA